MKKLQNLSLGFIILATILIIVELVIKYFVVKNFEPGEIKHLANSFIIIGRIENWKLTNDFDSALKIAGIIKWVIQLTIVLVFVRIQLIKIHKLFKYSTTLIVFGWIGNYLDPLFFANGNKAYAHLDYFNFNLFGNAFINLSSLTTLLGWILLIIALILKYKDLKILFTKESSTLTQN